MALEKEGILSCWEGWILCSWRRRKRNDTFYFYEKRCDVVVCDVCYARPFWITDAFACVNSNRERSLHATSAGVCEMYDTRRPHAVVSCFVDINQLCTIKWSVTVCHSGAKAKERFKRETFSFLNQIIIGAWRTKLICHSGVFNCLPILHMRIPVFLPFERTAKKIQGQG